MLPENINVAPDETVLFETQPQQVAWGGCTVMVLGIFLFLIPTLFGFLYWRYQRRQHRDSRCLITNQRIIVQNWGERGRLLDLGYDTITGIYPSSGSALGSTSSGSAVINLSDGTRIELDYVEGVAHFADVAQRAMEAYKGQSTTSRP